MVRKISMTLLILILLTMAVTGIYSVYRESKVKQVNIGMTKTLVENLLGEGRPSHMAFVCETCPEDNEQLVYYGNASLWYGNLEDFVAVCYVENIACGVTRTGL